VVFVKRADEVCVVHTLRRITVNTFAFLWSVKVTQEKNSLTFFFK